jgi:predicted AlkP superfamily phosphohydrolase/phosphomutase
LNDPLYKKSKYFNIIPDYYKIFDIIVGEYINSCPDASYLIISDHGHHSRPYKVINLNEFLRQKKYIIARKNQSYFLKKMQRSFLKIIDLLDIEHLLLKIVTIDERVIKKSKSLYSSSAIIDKNNSIAFLSNFAGIKSYSFGGIEINKDIVSNNEYEKIRQLIISELKQLKINNKSPFIWIIKREDLYSGPYITSIFPDILFKLDSDIGIGWDVYSKLEGVSFDHKIASGGHSEKGVFLPYNSKRGIRDNISIIDIAPSVLDLFEIDNYEKEFDGKSAFL